MTTEQNGESLDSYIAAARHERAKEAANIAQRQRSVELQKDHSGSPLDWFFADREIRLCREFLERMAASGYEKSQPVSGPSFVTTEQSKGWFGVTRTRQVRHNETLHGYDIGWALKPYEKPGSVSPSEVKTALLCSDGNLHLKDGGSIPSVFTIATGRTNIRTTTERDLYDAAWLIPAPLGERLAQLLVE